MIHSATDLRRQPLTDDELILDRLRLLLERANRRQFWMLFLNDDDTLAEAIMPTDDLPTDAEKPVMTDVGALSNADALARSLAHVMPEFGFARAIFVWERPGGARAGDEERRWARALADACGARGVSIAGQFLAYDEGIRSLSSAEFD